MGAGNATMVIDETADIEEAARNTRISKTNDYGSGCSADGNVVVKNGEVPVVEPFDLESSQMATKRVDIQPYFQLGRIGRFKLTASMHIKEWSVTVNSMPVQFDVVTGAQAKPKTNIPSYTKVFGESVVQEAEADERVVAITAAMPGGTGLDIFEKRFPDRCFDVGIAEQHAVTMAAGMACEGLRPVCAIYSTFLQRAYDQLIHDVALQKLPMVLALDRAGIVGADGATHAGLFDIAFLRCVPHVSVACPADEDECRKLLTTAYQQDHAVAVRYPRGAGVGRSVEPGLQALPFATGEVRRQGTQIAILAFGTLLYPALEVGEALGATVANMRWAKPLDEALVLQLAREHQALATLEEGAIAGGAGSAVLECLALNGVSVPVLQLGLGDALTDHGDPAKLLAEYGLDAHGIEQSIRRRFPQDNTIPLRA